jgi:threonine dehydrogenase-like Zn-dependent dehydrogenase
MEQMLDLCAATGPNVGLLLDCWHWYTSLGTVAEIRSLEPQQVVYVHINDAPRGINLEHQQDGRRELPGATGVIDIGGFLEALRAIGYDGPVVPEPFVADLARARPEEAAQRVGAAVRKVWSLPPAPVLPGTMKVVATGGGKAWLVDAPVPRPRGREVVVRMHACPVCGSNMHAFHDDGEHVNQGHEGAGEVVAVEQSNLLQVGDRVALAPLNACGGCADCRRGDVIFCRHRPEVHGTFAPYVRVADVMCTRIPDALSYEHAALMGCGLGPAYEALKRLNVGAFDTVVVAGLGPVGLGATALAAFRGARVVAFDPEPHRRKLAGTLGAAIVLDPVEPGFREAITTATGGRGIAKAVDCSGSPEAQLLLIEQAAVRGAIAFVGENAGTIALSPSAHMIRKGLTLHGCWHMNVLDASDLVTFLLRAPGKAELLISHRFGFDRAQEAFETFASRKTAKVLLIP